MKLTFVSNYINHHQIPLSNELYRALGEEYTFVQTEPMAEERRAMGWGIADETLPYLRCYYEEPEACRQLILTSDIVIFGGVEDERYIEERLASGRPVIRYSERLYREGQWKAVSPRGLIRKYKDHTRYRDKEVYLLCSGAYVASDFHIVRAYPGKMLKWGYFTETKQYDPETLFGAKGSVVEDGPDGAKGSVAGGAIDGAKVSTSRVPEILFAGRFLPLKHPEYAVELAAHLRKQGLLFHLTMVGGGELEEELHRMVSDRGLDDCVTFTGYRKPQEVREFMERADIFLMTSNYLEGWGAVINEAMNSGCAVVADAKIGAVPFLLRHRQSGMVYRDGDMTEFLAYGEQLVRDRELCRRLGQNAYDTIVRLWNPESAAKALLDFAEGILKHEWRVRDEGPCSPALVISPGKGYSYTRKTDEQAKQISEHNK